MPSFTYTPTPQTQFYKASVFFSMPNGQSVAYPVLPGAQFTCPKNWAIPAIIGNYWQFNYAEGLRNPAVTLQFIPIDAPGNILSFPAATPPSTLLNFFLSRTQDPAHDTVPIPSLTFFDGRTGFVIYNVKADSFTIGTSKGDDLRFSATFVGTQISFLSPQASVPLPPATGYIAPPLRFQNCYVLTTGNTPVNAWSFELTFQNNHTPDLTLNGTTFPIAQNAGMMTAGCRITSQAYDWSGIWQQSDGLAPLSYGSEGSLSILIQGANNSCTITLPRVIDQTPSDRSINTPRVMRQHYYVALGTQGSDLGQYPNIQGPNFVGPINISSTY